MPTALTAKSPRPSRRTSRTAFTAEPPDPDDPLLGFAPYLHTAPRRNSITPDRQRGFIAMLAASGIVTQAARSIGASLEALYKLRSLPGAEGFAAAWEAAIDRGVARLEDCALELALTGEELPIVSAGHLLGTYRKHNFGHIRFMLSQRRAGRFGASGGGVRRIDLAALAPDDPALVRLREQWLAEWEAEQEQQRWADTKDNQAFMLKLTNRLEALRQEAVDGGLMELQPDGSGVWTDPDLCGCEDPDSED